MKYEIGIKIRQYREAKRISQKQMAEQLGISNSRISNWEQGINRPDAEMIANICRVLDVSPSELLGVHLDSDSFTIMEKKVIYAYRENPELQHAIHVLLGIDE